MPLKTMKLTTLLKYGVLSGAVLFALALGMFGSQGQPQEAQAAPAGQIEAVALNQSLCISLGSAFGGLAAIDAALGCQGATLQSEFQGLVNCLAKTRRPDGTLFCPDAPPTLLRPEPDFFNGLDLDKNQIFSTQPYLIIAYVADDAPVRFITQKGSFITHGGDNAGQDFFCAPDNPLLPGAQLDPDCDGDAATAGDGVVVARLLLTDADGDTGTFSVSAIQEGVAFPIEMTLTGSPEKITLTPLFGKDTIQTGATPATPTSSCVNRNQPGLCQEPDSTDCNFGATADAVLGAVGQAEKTIVVAKALDDRGVELVGVLINWGLQAGFPDEILDTTPANGTFAENRFKTGGVALPQTPTLDAQALGVGFPQFICGGEDTGTIDLVAWFAATLSPTADRDEHEEVTINVIGPAEEIALTAVPAEIDCNGINTSTVTATVVNGEGDPVANGLDVNFSVVALGTANPLLADTALGVASTVIKPLAGANNATADGQPRGVTVLVSVKGDIDINEEIGTEDDPNAVEHQTWEIINRSILVRCSGGPPPPGTGDAGAGGAAPPPPSGTISPPDTGTGGQDVAEVPMMALAALAAGAAALAGTRLAVRRK